ncbi:Non-repetitive/WGA-negative nucleoporin C-terminal-domain-containing protein [Phellopilus nigrolimitatus]|nr:Non-repetitive/WGA-negative nucleoporin C-terminal-domain-containing protein [Phellopilus nigrolimitatus]
MEVDGQASSQQRENKNRSGVVFAQSEELSVTLLAHLPAEVLQVLRSTDFASDAFTGDIDTRSSFCLIASSQTCFVWKHSQLLLGAPTCYIFPCPSRYSEPSVPFSAIVSYGPSREPGLILLSPYGETRFWDSVELGLTGGDPTDDSLIDLRSDEAITAFVYAEPQTFIATTSGGRLFLLAVTSTAGRFSVIHHPFSLQRPQSTIERLRFFPWGETAPVYSSGCVTAAAVNGLTDEGFEVWACMDLSIVKWNVIKKGWEQFEFEEDINDVLFTALKAAFSNVKSEEELDLELLDIAFDSQNDFILLTSFNPGLEDESGMDTRPRRFYVVARLSRDGRTFTVKALRTVPYQTISSDKANIHPRLRLLEKGLVYCVEFGDAVAFVAKDTQYANILTLKSLQDRTFGCGVVNDSAEMLFMNSDVLMKVAVDVEKINSFDSSTGRGTSIKSIMTQAILFGSNPKNPLLFTFPPDVDEESLISGAEQLSRGVLASDIEVVRSNPDLTQQIIERKDRLRFLIGFINENGGLGKMSQSSRQRLATDAEKLYAAQQLWTLYCHRVNAGFVENVLLEIIIAYMERSQEGHHEDIMRAFFRLQTREIGNLLPYIKSVTEDILRSFELTEREPDAFCRGSEYLLCIMQSTWNYRDTNSGIYGLAKPMLNSWTSTPPVIDIVLDFFNLADKRLVETPPENAENAIVREVRSQLPKLAAVVFRCFQERLEWLESPAAADEAAIENEKRAFRDRFQQIRPQVLHTLLKHDMTKHAFQLAEDYRDFRSLADLCHSTSPIYPLESNVHAELIRQYIDDYKEEFTDELYQWYIEHGELRCMFAQSELYEAYIDTFFAKHPHPTISWVHDLGKGCWDSAALTLLAQAGQTPDLATRNVMLSIGKLAQIADNEASPADVSQNTVLDDFHDGLDYVSVHQKLIEELRATLAGSKARQSLEHQVDTVVKAVAPSLKARTYPAFLAEFRACVKALLQNHVLGVEDIVDVLTLREDSLEYATALELIKNAKNIPEGRQLSAFRTVWRRIYIHDDWAQIRKTANTTDTQLVDRFRRTALYSTVKDALRRTEPPAESDEEQNTTTILPLDEAAQLPAPEELASRWPGHADEQLATLAHDYESEKQRLEQLDLVSVIDRVKELAVQELEDELGGAGSRMEF